MGLPRFLSTQNNYFALRFSRWVVKQTEVIISLALPISHNSSKWSRFDTRQDVDRWPRLLSVVADIRAPDGNDGWRLLIKRRKPKHLSGSWWRHQMETFSALLAFCAENSPVPVNSPHKGQWRGALMFSLICTWINNWVNNAEAGDLRRHRAHCDVSVMSWGRFQSEYSSPVYCKQRLIQWNSWTCRAWAKFLPFWIQ